MAKIEIKGFQSLEMTMEEIAQMPDEVMFEMIDAGATILESKLRTNAKTMLKGPYYKGDVASHTKKKKPEHKNGVISQTITWDGTIQDEYHKNGTRAAEIAFYNEFGVAGKQPARPFMQAAVASTEEACVKAEQQVLENYLAKKFSN